MDLLNTEKRYILYMTVRIGINGFGRIGQLVMRASYRRSDVEVVAINATKTPGYVKYQLGHDTVHPEFCHQVEATEEGLVVDGRKISMTSERDPRLIPWGKLGVDFVVDATGNFKTIKDASAHLDAGAKKVVITAPSPDAPTFVMGVNEDRYDDSMDIVSNASCTTNALAPLAKVLNDGWGIDGGIVTAVHAVTASQSVQDGNRGGGNWRLGRAAMSNIIPSSTGAAKTIGKVIPSLDGILNGTSLRVPVLNVSCIDFNVVLKTSATYEQICEEVARASQEEMSGILGYTEDAVVSSDFIHDARSAIFDAGAGMQLQSSKLTKLLAWYDNEWAYSCRVIDLIHHMASQS